MANQSANYLHLQLHHTSNMSNQSTCHHSHSHPTWDINDLYYYAASLINCVWYHSVKYNWINCICGWQKLAHSEPRYLNSQCTYLSRYIQAISEIPWYNYLDFEDHRWITYIPQAIKQCIKAMHIASGLCVYGLHEILQYKLLGLWVPSLQYTYLRCIHADNIVVQATYLDFRDHL